MFDLVIANLRSRRIRTLISVIGVALGTALVLLFTGLARGMSHDMQRRATNWNAEIIFTRPGGMELMSSNANLSIKYVELLKQTEGVQDAVPAIRYLSPGKGRFGLEQLDGVDWSEWEKVSSLRITRGRAAISVDEVVVDEKKARDEKLGPGSTVYLFGRKPYRVTGVFSPEAGARTKMSLKAMQEALEVKEKCTYILIKCKEGYDEKLVARRINEKLPGNKLQFTRDLIVNMEKNLPYLGTFLRVLVVFAAIVSSLFITLSLYTTITERTREIGILKSLGASRVYIIGLIEQEALVISFLGLIVGIGVSFATGFLIRKFFGLVFEIGWDWGIVAVLMILVSSTMGALYPALRASAIDPVQALAYE